MAKGGSEVVSAENIYSLNSYIKNSEDSFLDMERAYKKKDPELFNKAKVTLIQSQKAILENIK